MAVAATTDIIRAFFWLSSGLRILVDEVEESKRWYAPEKEIGDYHAIKPAGLPACVRTVRIRQMSVGRIVRIVRIKDREDKVRMD